MGKNVVQSDQWNYAVDFKSNAKVSPLDYVEFCEIQIQFLDTTWSIYAYCQ